MEFNNPPDENPFAAPTVQSLPTINPATPRFWGLLGCWMLVFAVNLPLPVMWGLAVTEGNGPAGIILGCLAVNVTGIWLCRQTPYFMVRLCIGAVPVAVSQFVPMVQMFAGLAAMSLTNAVFHLSVNGPPNNMQGILEVTFCTIVTGLELILLSLAFGYIFAIMFSLPTAPKDRSATL